MASTSKTRNRLIDRLIAISNSDYLKAPEKIIDSSNVQGTSIGLTAEQKIMLAMSDTDIQTGRLIDQDFLNKQELNG